MAAYATVPPDDPFAVSKAMFDALAAELAGPAAAGLRPASWKISSARRAAR